MKTYSIKTVDGNRYETDEIPLRTTRAGIDWLYFPVKDGVGFKYINVQNIVSMTERTVDNG